MACDHGEKEMGTDGYSQTEFGPIPAAPNSAPTATVLPERARSTSVSGD